MTLDQLTRQQLADLLNGGNAHRPFQEAVEDFPVDKINHRPANVPYSYWHLVEHLRLTQRDILNYLLDADYEEPFWPKDYWPAPDATTDETGWNASIAGLVAIAQDRAADLTSGAPSHPVHTVLREILIVAVRNACHVGELAIPRQGNQLWGASHE